MSEKCSGTVNGVSGLHPAGDPRPAVIFPKPHFIAAKSRPIRGRLPQHDERHYSLIMDSFSRFGACCFMLLSVAYGQGFKTEWTQTFRTPHPCGFSPIGAVDEHDDLWLLCPNVRGGGLLGSLLQIDSAGKVRSQRELPLTLPANADGLTTDIQMASSGPTVGVLVSTTRWEGRTAYFEGAYFMLLRGGELTTPVRISAPGL